ncbi:MAG: RNA 2',3'-cyclic phosphodiesterase [Myxococcales bacterium]|nr:RNA 2',3'-cyclic phosphodiesterase [Myxococcales bacterium]
MQRLFTALTVSDAAADALSSLCHGIPGARWTLPGEFHLTLRFIGDLGPEATEDLKDALDDVNGPPFDLALEGTGVFESRGAPRVLWAGMARNDSLFELQRAVERAILAAGLPPDRRRFHAHVTLARLPDAEHISERVAEFLTANAEFRTEPWKVDAFRLYSSRLRDEGPLYEMEVEWPLDM